MGCQKCNVKIKYIAFIEKCLVLNLLLVKINLHVLFLQQHLQRPNRPTELSQHLFQFWNHEGQNHNLLKTKNTYLKGNLFKDTSPTADIHFGSFI